MITIFNSLSGIPLRTWQGHSDLIDTQLRDGEDYIQGEYHANSYEIVRVDGQWQAIQKPMSMERRKALRLAALAALRWQKETSGISLGNNQIVTDRNSQAMISAAFSATQIDPSRLIDFKTANGWVQINAAQIARLADAVATYVQSCFSRERNLTDEIAASDNPETVDITQGWPTQSFGDTAWP